MRPANEIELSDAVRSAAAALSIVGGDTRRVGPLLGDRLLTAGLNGISLYEPGALTLVAKAGTPVADIEATLAAERQRLAFEVPDLRALLGRNGSSTIGGVVAANASGPRRVQVGACRDALLGVRFVDGNGTIIKNGGRVMKNVTGYDLVKLLAGSHGTLGVLSEVAFKVQALPEAETTLISTRPMTAGLQALNNALTSPFDISGAAYATGRALIRVEGMAGSVAYRTQELQRRLGGDWGLAQGADSATLWRDIRDVTPFAHQEGAVWRLAVKPSEAGRIASQIGGEALFDWGGGLVWLLTAGGIGAQIRATVAGHGHATLIRPTAADAGTPTLPPEAAAVATLTAALRAKFDPKGIFNTGIMG